jgi:starch-binding outer membrane protein, SusD/RagB family
MVGAGIVTLLGCNMDVEFPGTIAASDFDPTADAATLSLSAQSDVYRALSAIVHFSAFFSQEAWVGAVRQETNDIGRRVATAGTADVNNLWGPLQRAIATNELAIQVLAKGTNANSDINLARAAMNSGFALELLAEHFCQGAFLVGPPLTPAQVSDTAIARFTRAITIASSITGVAEATKIVNASNVGLARARLQKKDYAGAAAAAALVPATFVYNAIMVDDASNRGLGNGVFSYDQSALIIVPDPYRALNDPRVAWRDAGRRAQDTQFQYYQQLKYTGFATAIRIASGLEASYIAAEARLGTGDQAAALTLIAARRAANNQPAFTGTGAAAVLAELMNQRAREFWLEAKHAGDIVRNPAAAAFLSPAGSTFYKSAQGTFGNAVCLPVPLSEVNANPNFPKS